MPPRTYILDATPLFTGYTPALSKAPHYTTNEIMEELGENERLRLSTDNLWLQIKEPSKKSLEEAHKAASQTGDKSVLSKSDLSILALSLDMLGNGSNATLITDDYAVQNVASKLGIPFQNYAWRGIRKTIKWRLYCPSCRKTYNTSRKTCPNCGSTLRRRAIRSEEKTAHVKH